MVTLYFQSRVLQAVEGDEQFDHSFFKGMYRMAYKAPFKWFVEENENKLTPKGEKLKEQLILSGFDRYFTVKSFMAFKAAIFMASMLLAGLSILFLDKMGKLISLFQTLPTEIRDQGITPNLAIVTFVMYLIFPLVPSIMLKNKAKKAIVNNVKDLPMIYMFTILMLRSGKTVMDILFALTKLNTHHKDIFEQGYRIYVRNKNEGMNFYRDHFDNERFAEMFTLLEDISEYAREDTISILEGNMKSLVENTNMVRRRNDLSQLVYSQASMTIPFLAVILLGAIPIVVMAIQIFSNSMMTL
jgi:hypothetical protein